MKKIILSTMALGLTFVTSHATESVKDSPKFNVSGEVEFDTYAGMVPSDDPTILEHEFATTFGLVFQVNFNEKWSAEASIEADGDGVAPSFLYNGAFVQYAHNEDFAIKAGDLTFSEGAFRYYNYDDPADDAIGMKEANVRGLEVNFKGLQIGAGLVSDDNEICLEIEGEEVCEGAVDAKSYLVHAAYDFGFLSHVIRPYVNYKSYQEENHNALRAGVTANFVFGETLNLQGTYVFFADYLSEDSPKASHAFALEPELSFGKVSIKASAFYALLDEDNPTEIDALSATHF